MGIHLPGVLTLNSYALPDNLSFPDWQEVGYHLRQIDSGAQWWIGDWLNFGERRYGEKYSQELQDNFGLGYDSLSGLAKIAKRYGFGTRVPNVSWAHHRVVAWDKFSIQDRTAYLRAARLYGLTRDQFEGFVHRHERKKRLRAIAKRMPGTKKYDPDSNIELDSVNVADIHDLRLLPNSIDMIFTDPPYDFESLTLYAELGRLAARVLKPGSYLMTYSGQMHLNEVMRLLSDQLEYVWTFCVYLPGQNQSIHARSIFDAWHPILAFKKPGETTNREWTHDFVEGTRDKEFHEWQQQMEPPLKYIPCYTLPGDIILDPFVGGGTTVIACQKTARHFIAFDKDPNAVKFTLDRLTPKRIARIVGTIE